MGSVLKPNPPERVYKFNKPGSKHEGGFPEAGFGVSILSLLAPPQLTTLTESQDCGLQGESLDARFWWSNPKPEAAPKTWALALDLPV